MILFSDSRFIGGAGICSSGGVVCVAVDFPLWFVLFTLLHELGHFFMGRLPVCFQDRYEPEARMELFTEHIIGLLSVEDRGKAVLVFDKIYRYIEWEREIFG